MYVKHIYIYIYIFESRKAEALLQDIRSWRIWRTWMKPKWSVQPKERPGGTDRRSRYEHRYEFGDADGMGWEGLKKAAKASANFVNRLSWSWRSWSIYIDLNHSLWADPIQPCWKVSAVQAGSFLKESDLDVTLKAAARSFPKSPQQALQWIVS